MQVEILHIFKGHADAVYALCKGENEDNFYSGSADKFVGSWNIATQVFEKPLVKTAESIYALLHDSKQKILYVGQRKGILLKVDLQKKSEPKAIQAHEKDIFSIAQDPNGKIYTGGGDGHVKIWNENLELIQDLPLSNKNVRCIRFNLPENEIIVGLSDHTIRILDVNTLQSKQILHEHKNSVFTIEFIDSQTFVSGGRDAVFHIWKKQSDAWKSTSTIPAHLYTVNHLTLSPDGKILASASRDKSIKLWDAKQLRLHKVIDRSKFPQSHTHSVNRLLWIDHNLFLSTGDDRKIILWKISKDK